MKRQYRAPVTVRRRSPTKGPVVALGKGELGAQDGNRDAYGRKTMPVRVGDVCIGGENPVVVQGVIDGDTLDVHNAIRRIGEYHEASSEILRVTCVDVAYAHAVGALKKHSARNVQGRPAHGGRAPHRPDHRARGHQAR